MLNSEPIRTFISSAAARFGAHRSEIGTKIAAALEKPRDLAPRSPRAMLPAMDGMAGACDPLVEVLVPCLPLLEWRAPGFGRLSPEIADKMAVCEILGPDGMFIDPDIRFGLLVQRAHLLYPPHRHAAEELYLVLQGTALWAVDGEEPRPRRPGEFVHHAPRRTHAMRTEAEQLLAAWAWTGDIGAATYSA